MQELQPTVSVVDDDYSVRRSIVRLLVSCGLAVEAFASAQEYLEADHPNGVDCLILDVYLGGMSGIELSERLAASDAPPPIIFITAHDDEQTRELVRRRVAAGYFRKPFDPPSLLATLGHVLGRDFGDC
jgi:FixJ family two-component response regulator